jgi:hypothetical protein
MHFLLFLFGDKPEAGSPSFFLCGSIFVRDFDEAAFLDQFDNPVDFQRAKPAA